MLSRQRGLGGAFVAIVLLLVAVVALASLGLSRLISTNRASEKSTAGLAQLADAMEQFVAATGRLPCPANPALPTTDANWGVEVVPSPNLGVCTHPDGTVPWMTIAAKADDALDAWGWKVSYRVFTGTAGTAGSLTQDGGASMVRCDTVEPTAGNATGVSGVKGGLCAPDPDPTGDTTLRSTVESMFLANKGMTVAEKAPSGAVLKTTLDVAYVLLSHGSTGVGAYSASGQRNSMPAVTGDEFSNTSASGPFVIKPFSEAGTEPTLAAHYDDRLVYRTLPDLVKRTKLGARNWPDAGNVVFNRSTLEATSLGTGFTPDATTGSVGQVSVTFSGVVATGVASSTPTDISFVEAGSYSGIGVAGGGSALIQSPANEFLIFQFADTTNTKFAATLGDFGTYGTFSEFVVFAFFSGGLGGTNVATKGGLGCNIDGGLASFSMDVGVAYDTVAIASAPAFDSATATFSGVSAFLVNEVTACRSTAVSCVTSLTTNPNTCVTF